MKKVFLVSLGCARAEVDSEKMIWALNEKGYKQVYSPEESDIILINTCAFIEAAREESISTIEEMKEEYPDKKIIVTGCLVELTDDNFMDIPLQMGVGKPPYIAEIVEKEGRYVFEDKWRDPDQGIKRILQTPPHYAYLRIADGCNNRCTFCIIPKIRGRLRSREYKYIKEEMDYLISQGVREIILASEDTTAYGDDIGDSLLNILKRMKKDYGKEDIFIRLMYLHPARVKEDLIEFMKESEIILPYLDIPIQHVNKDVLKNMGRPTKPMPDDVLKMIKDIYPEITIRTTVMVGFPGETEEAFNELYEFLSTDIVDKFGGFVFSPEEGTPAYDMEKIDDEISHERLEILEELNAKKYADYVNSLESLDVIVEEIYPEDKMFLARGINDAPEVDFSYEVGYKDQPPQIGDIVRISFEDTGESE